MSSKSNYVVIGLILLVILIGFLYYKVELPKRQNLENSFINVSIATKFNNQITPSKIIIQNGETREVSIKESYELLQLRKDLYKIYTENKNFYTTELDLNLTGSIENNTRVDLILEEPKDLSLILEENNSIISLNIKSENFKNVKYCLNYSYSYVFVNTEDEKIKLEEYPSLKCYDLKKSLKNTNETILISYDTFGIPDEDDFINIIILDSDNIEGVNKITQNGEDLWAKNKMVRLR